VLLLLVTANVPSSPIIITLKMDDDNFLRNVGSYESHTIISHKTVFFIVSVVKILDLTNMKLVLIGISGRTNFKKALIN
jgi:hypothetical protein